jgi:catechol 2,3-dioxygenase-like lactoylglutathione lyase family enzyme
MTEAGSWRLDAMLIIVSNLDRSVQFYTDVCGLQAIVRGPDHALLGLLTTGPPALALREADRRGVRAGQQSLGIRGCSFYVGTDAQLERVEARLRSRSAFEDRQRCGKDDRVQLVRGHDPDRLPLGFLSYEPPLTTDDYREMLRRIYSWDL